MDQSSKKFGRKRITNVFQEAWNGECHPGFVFLVFYLPGIIIFPALLDSFRLESFGMNKSDLHLLVAPVAFLLMVMIWRSIPHAKRWYVRFLFRLLCLLTCIFCIRIVSSYTGLHVTMNLEDFTELNY